MNINSRGAAVYTALFILVLSFAVCGCGGGGSSSSIFFDNPQNISVKLNMLDRTPSQAYVSIPQNALGTVNISVISIKDKKEVANKTVDYSLNAFTFDNQIPAGDTYSVIVTARLKERANDIYESIWQGSGIVTVLNAEKALKNPGANEVSVSLVFRTIEYIKLYPTKIVFEPALPVGEITPSTIIPSFKLSVLDQFGNTMTSENGLISVSLENGSFKDSINSKNLANGSAVFSNLAVSSLIPDQAGYIKLKAVYGSLTAYSQPIKSSGAVIPDSLLAGYLTDDSAAASGMQKSYAPLAGKEIKVICGNLQYFTVTDSSGFFKLDLKAGPSEVPVYIEFLTSSGSAVRLQTFIKGSKVKLANIRIGPGGEPRLITSELAASYDSKLDAQLVKKAIDDEIALKASSGSAAGFSGRVQAAGTGAAVAGASLTIEKLSVSVQTDQNGNFTLSAAQGVLTAGDYMVSMSAGGYGPQSQTVSVSSFDYGFIVESIIFNAVEKPNTPPSLSIKSVSGSSQNISIVFDLFDAENDPCQIDVQYSLNGGYSYLPTSNASGALSNVYPGANLSAVWFSASDFLSDQSSVRVKLIPRDYRAAGQAGESGIFAVNNKIADPENNPPVIMGVIVSGERGDISVKYDLMDQDGDSCAVELYYSTDGGTTFTRSPNYSSYGRREFPATGLSLVWNSALDFQSEEKNLKIRLTPNDSRSSGTSGESGVFYVNNIKNTPPVIQNLSVSGNYKDISLSYDLIELDGHLCTVEVSYSLDGGLNYINTVNLSGETSSVAAGQGKTLIWHSYSDFTSVNKTVYIKAAPSDKYGYGTEAVFGPFAVYNGGGRPEISQLAVSGNSKIIDISYELKDIDASPCTVEVYYSRDGGSSFVQSGYVEGDIHAVAPGANKSIKWNSYGDFRTSEKSVVIKLLPIDDFGAGTEAVSIAFEVNNNINRPTIANLLTKVNSGEVEIVYDVDDLDASTCHVQFQYATEASGGYLNSIFVTGETAEVFPGAGKTLLWNSKGDFTENYDSVSVKLIVSDDGGPGGEAISQPFKVYNNASSEIFINSVAGNSQNITVDFNLIDAEGDASNIEVFYSRDGGVSFIKTASVTGSISNVTPANNLKLVWESAKDIVNQNASGVILKLAAIDSKGNIQNFNVSQPFTVNNYVPPPVVVPVLQNAEMISDKKIKLIFSVPVTVSDTAATLAKIKINGFAFDSAYDSLTYSSNTIIITANSSPFMSIFMAAQSDGITVDESNEGLKFLSGNGIKSSTGTEVAVNSTGFGVSSDTTPPDQLTSGQLALVIYRNSVQQVYATGDIEFSENSYFHVYAGSVSPEKTTTSNKISESYMSGAASGNVILGLSPSPLPPGDTVYYRLADRAGNLNEWQADGVIPSAPPAEVLKWSNASLSAYNTSIVGSEGDKLKIYENLSATTNYRLTALSAAPANGYPANTTIQCTGSPISDAYFVYYTLVNQSGNESDYTSGGMVPAPPESTIVSNLKLRYNTSGAYEIYNNHNSNFTFAGSLRVVINDGSANTVIGRTNISTLNSGSFVGSAGYDASESLNGDGLKTSMVNGGTLKFSYVDNSTGNESSYASDATTPGETDYVPPKPDFNNFKPVSTDIVIKIVTSDTGTSKDIIQVYEKSGGAYSFKANTNTYGPFLAENQYTLSQSFSIAISGSASYTFKGISGNESVISDDTIHLAGILDHFQFALASPQTLDLGVATFSGTNQLFARDYYAQAAAVGSDVTLTVNSGPDGTITGLGSGGGNVLQPIDFDGDMCNLTGMVFDAQGDVSPRTFKAVSNDSKQGISNEVSFTLP